MKLVILFNSAYPSFGAAAKRVGNYEKGLKALGADIQVIPIPPLTQNPLFQILVPIYTLIRILTMKPAADILFIYGFGWVSKLFIVYYGKLIKSKIVFEVNEKPHSIRGAGRRDIFLKYFAPLNQFLLTRIIYPLADGFVVISDELHRFVSAYASGAAKIIKIPVIVDTDFYKKAETDKAPVEHPSMIHTATLNDIKDGILDVFRAFILLHKKHKINLHFYLANKIGLPGDLNNLQRMTEENNLANYVHFLDRPDDELLARYQAAVDFTIINKRNTEQNRYNFATKIGEFSALGTCILMTNYGEVNNYFADNRNCLFINDTDPELIASRVAELLQNDDLKEKLSCAGRETAENHFSLKATMPRLFYFFKSILYK